MKEALLATENKDVSKRSPDFRQLKTEIYRSCGLVKTIRVDGQIRFENAMRGPIYFDIRREKSPVTCGKGQNVWSIRCTTRWCCQYAHPEAETLMVY